MNDDVIQEEGDPPVVAGPLPDAPEPKTAGPVKAWVFAYAELGLLNAVVKSQEELVNWINDARRAAGQAVKERGANSLVPIRVLSNSPSEPDVAFVWLDPLLILAVLDEFVPRPGGATGAPKLPPALLAMIAGAEDRPASEEDVAVVVVEPEPEPGRG